MWRLVTTLALFLLPPPGTGVSVPPPVPTAPAVAAVTATAPGAGGEWRCPEIANRPQVECSCDMPHTLRCAGGRDAVQLVGRALRSLDAAASVSLLDCTVQNLTTLPGPLLEGVALHGLVVSSGEIREIHRRAFAGLAGPLQALGLPNNLLATVPIAALSALPSLDRLDLSNNRLKAVDAESFKGLFNLTFLDLSDNLLSAVTPNAFSTLPQIRTLRLRGNKLNMITVSKINSFDTLEELDLSSNSLVGPVGPNTLPKMKQLRDLQLAHNMLSSIRRGALEGLQNLTSLILHHNQIDVLEDHAFSQLSSLVHLDLAHNRIVAVSGASLAHLTNLTELDLRHNFLRALTADLVLPLTSLKDLRVDDNDISIIASDALRPETILHRLTLSDNPLNCDCSLIDFAVWLSNSSAISKEDRSTAVCTTPPSLENGLLIEVPTTDLLCGEDEQEALMAPVVEPVAKTQVTLKDFKYDGVSVSLQWEVDSKAVPYTCDAIFVYEEEGPNEVLLESNPLRCNSSELKDPLVLNVTVPGATDLQMTHRYRYCVVLLESGQSDELSLVLGCSEVIPLIPNVKVKPRKESKEPSPRITSVQANLTTYGSLSMQVALYPSRDCVLNIAILQQGNVLSQRRINCSEPKYVFVGMRDGPYRVCANIVAPGPMLQGSQRPRCVMAVRREPRGLSGLDVALVAVFLVLCLMLVAVVWGVRRILLKPKIQTHQCFLPPDDVDEHQHSRYVKLQATTKL